MLSSTDDIYIAAPPEKVIPQLKQLREVTNERADGFTWLLEGSLRGRGEWWFEPFKSGTIVHYYFVVEHGSKRRARKHRMAIRARVNAVKDDLEAAEHAR